MDNINGQVNNEIGKHYVIGDLHGMYGTYLDAINSINDEDTLYVLGDVIDFGPRGIKILQDMMKRPNIRLILGDHEWNLMRCYDIMKKYDLSVQEFVYYTRKYNLTIQREADLLSEESYEHGLKSLMDILNRMGHEEKKISKSEQAQIAALINDGGISTLKDFVLLSEEEQEQLMKYLVDSMVIAFVRANKQKICLVHAAPYDKKFFIFMVDQLQTEESIRYKTLMNIGQKFLDSFMVGCTERSQDQFKSKSNPFEEMHKIGVTTIYGHTPQAGQATRCIKDDSICIDISDDGAALYCMEDGLVRYIGKSIDDPTNNISAPAEPKVIEDRLENFIQENEIQGTVSGDKTYTPPVIETPNQKSQTDPENPSDPSDPADSGDR